MAPTRSFNSTHAIPRKGTFGCSAKSVATFIGRIERGFDFLGYRFTRAGLSVARKTIENFLEKASRLYEQECRAALPATALEMYVKRRVRWATNSICTRPTRESRGAFHPQELLSPARFLWWTVMVFVSASKYYRRVLRNPCICCQHMCMVSSKKFSG